MRIFSHHVVFAGLALVTSASFASAMDMMSDEELTKSAESAAPEYVAKDATILGFDKDMKMRTIREGSNGFSCMPDVPETPGVDPMCVDKGGMAWTEAWLTHKDPPAGVVGFGYMLAGGSDADNMDPYAMQPPTGGEWVTTGPHVMIFNVGDMTKDYPTSAAPDTKAPFVMYPGTPYAHLMIPVQ